MKKNKKIKIEKNSRGEIIIYKPQKNNIEIEVKLEKETVWLDTHAIAKLFGIDRTGVIRHIANIYKTGELNKNLTCAKIAQVAADGKIRKMDLYNLDVIISVGYRTNSQKATAFRIWATRVLKSHLVQGYTINAKRLAKTKEKFNQLKNAINFLNNKISAESLKGQEKEIVNLLNSYARTLTILEQYDKKTLKTSKTKKAEFKIDYRVCSKIISELRYELIAKKEAG